MLPLLALGTGARASTPTPGAAAVPQRIVSLAPSITETLFALGAGPRVVAVSDYCDDPPEARRLPRIGSFLTPSLEAVLAMRPDVVIGERSPGNREVVETLRRLGVRVEIDEPARLADVPRVIRRIAAVAGVPDAGERLVVDLERRMAATRARIAGTDAPRVLMVVGQSPLVAVGPGTVLGDLLEQAGGRNVAPPDAPWPHLSVEVVIAADPEVIIDSSMGTEEGTATLAFWAPLASLAAVRNGRVYPFRDTRMLRPGPRIPEAFEDLARLLHPDRWR